MFKDLKKRARFGLLANFNQSSFTCEMKDQKLIDFERIRQSIEYIRLHHKEQPTLEQLAKYVHMSPFHFQRLFTRWCGVSPKTFLQYISLNHSKLLLRTKQLSLFDTTLRIGLSSTSRLHDLFVKIEAMSPSAFKTGGENLGINYSFNTSPFGSVLAASTNKGLCYMAFVNKHTEGFAALKNHFPNAAFRCIRDTFQENALQIFQLNWNNLPEVKLHLHGSPFQLKVWEALLKIPFGHLSTYKSIAEAVQQPKASRAVGTAIGSNPVSFLIPCHRVIQSSGEFGNYMWGPDRKAAIIGWESALTNGGEPK